MKDILSFPERKRKKRKIRDKTKPLASQIRKPNFFCFLQRKERKRKRKKKKEKERKRKKKKKKEKERKRKRKKKKEKERKKTGRKIIDLLFQRKYLII